MVSENPLAVDLFSGAGGLSLGLEHAGFRVATALEWNHGPAETHRRNFPQTPVTEADIRLVAGRDLDKSAKAYCDRHGLSRRSQVDLIAGGPPCQGYSFGGFRNVDDTRNALVHEFSRIVIEMHPRYFLMENVPGMLANSHREILDKTIKRLTRCGYEVAKPFIVNTSHLGVPQIRKRVLVVGWQKGETPVDTDLLQGIVLPQVTVGDAIGDVPSPEDEPEALQAAYFMYSEAASDYARLLRSDPHASQFGRMLDPTTISGCVPTLHSKVVVNRFRKTKPGRIEAVSRFKRLAIDGLSPTIRAGTGPDRGSHTSPRPIHYKEHRVITVREAARLQSFPDWFEFANTKWHAWHEIGNAVPPLLAREIGLAVRSVL